MFSSNTFGAISASNGKYVNATSRRGIMPELETVKEAVNGFCATEGSDGVTVILGRKVNAETSPPNNVANPRDTSQRNLWAFGLSAAFAGGSEFS